MGLTWDRFTILLKRPTNYRKQVALPREPGWNVHVFYSLQLKKDHTTLWLGAWPAFFLYCEWIESLLLLQKTQLKQNMVSFIKSLIFGLVILSLEEFKARIPVERVIQWGWRSFRQRPDLHFLLWALRPKRDWQELASVPQLSMQRTTLELRPLQFFFSAGISN